MIQVTCFIIVAVLVLVIVGQSYPWIWAVLAILIAAAIAFNVWQKRQNKIASIAAFKAQAGLVESFATAIETGKTQPAENLALGAGEVLLGSQDNVKLLEWVSTGSSYQGGSSGLSFRVMRGVSYRVGANRGTIVKNPPALRTVDVGTVNFTTKRVTFVGARETRAFDVAKILDLKLDHNGQTVMISVSNRQKPSGLQGAGFDTIAPGFLVQAALTMHNSGPTPAAAELRENAKQLRSAAETTRVELGLPASA